MKKYLFSAVSVFALFAYQAKAQQTATLTVKPDTNVKVMNGALLYVNGKMNVEAYVDTSKKVSNEGRVKITEQLKTAYNKTNNTASFVNEYTNGHYGQLIVNNGTPNEMKISSGVKASSDFVFLPLAIPYSGITAADVVKNLFGEDTNLKAAFPGYTKNSRFQGFDKNRLKNALFYWENNKFQFTHLGVDDELLGVEDAARYYAVNTKYAGNGQFSVNTLKHIDGVPVNNAVTVTVAKTDLTAKKNTDPNDYGEAYGSYITDFTVEMPQGWDNYHVLKEEGKANGTDFGSRVYNFGNPFTSNINLAATGNGLPWNQIKALVQYGSENYTDAINEGNASGSEGGLITSFSAMTEAGAGDHFLGYVAPFGTFAVKMKESMGSTEIFTFNDAMKTFDEPGDTAGGSLVKTMFAKAKGGVMPVINQVGLDLYDAKENFTGARTYVVASDIYEASQKGKGAEVYNPGMTDESKGIYTLQEKEDGSVDESLVNAKTYINGINADKYIAKPVHLVLQNMKGKYTLKARLNENLENNKNSFYFEDKATGKVQKVGKDFSYTFDVNGTEKDRFVLYWAESPKAAQVKDIVKEVADATSVVKYGDDFLVSFAKDMNRADVFVYNISGQLVSSERNVDAKQPYILHIKGNSSVYIVKVIGDNGQVTTKKVIK